MRPIKPDRPIILALDDRFHPPSKARSIDISGPEGAAQIQVQVFGRFGEKRLRAQYLKSEIAMVRKAERARCRNVLRIKPCIGPSSTGDWVPVKRALCKNPVLSG
jgi:hypothetical protein